MVVDADQRLAVGDQAGVALGVGEEGSVGAVGRVQGLRRRAVDDGGGGLSCKTMLGYANTNV